MRKIVIGLIDSLPWVKSALQNALDGGCECLDIPSTSTFGPAVVRADISFFLVGNHSEEPSIVSALVGRLSAEWPRALVLVLAWVTSERIAIAALKSGAADYIPAPIEIRDVASVIRLRADPSSGGQSTVRQTQVGRPIIGDSPTMQSVREYLLRVAQRDCNALIVGETGTGKDLIAEAIHLNSRRQRQPFVCVNCAAIPDTLLESELFGYERGAFTGANTAMEGKIHQAHKGTVFFDEIGEMTPYAQAKILRLIESKQIQRLGGKANIPVDVRIIAATNQDLLKLVEEQKFRRDLYFRLNVARIALPCLHERKEDIDGLLFHYVGVFNRETGAKVEGFTPEALECLRNYNWPGNVRELKNMVESIFVDPPTRIDVTHLWGAGISQRATASERDQLLEALQSTQWNKSKAADKLHWSRMKVYRKMAKYHIGDREETSAAVAG